MLNQTERNATRIGRALIAASLGLSLVLGLGAAPAEAQMAGQNLTAARESGIIRLDRARSEAETLRRLELENGKSVLMETGYTAKQVSVGDPDVLQVVVLSPNRLQLVPKKIGDTNLVIYDSSGRPQAVIDVHVGTANSQIEAELRRVLGNDTIIVDSAGDSVVLKGSVSSVLAMERAISVAQAYFPKDPERHVINLLEVGGNQQVMIDIKIAEMDRTLSRNLTANWHVLNRNTFEIFSFLDNLTSIDEDVVLLSQGVNIAYTYLGGNDVFTQIFLQALHEKGLAKILAEPTVVARSGETANFLVGGEVPIPIAQGGANAGSITVQFKPFGVGVAFTPTVLSEDRIHLQISPEVSEIDDSISVAVSGFDVPGFSTRRASTSVELADGQSFAIAGLLRDNVNELVRQYPFVGDIPVLGALFRSTAFINRQTELTLIVTPHLVKPLGPGPHPLPTDHFVEPSFLDTYLLGALEGTGAGARGVRAQAGSTHSASNGGLIGDFGHRVVVSEAEKEL